MNEIGKIARIAAFLIFLHGLRAEPLVTNSSVLDICGNECICGYISQNCTGQNSPRSLRVLTRVVNYSTELFSVENCYSDEPFDPQWLYSASGSLRHVIIRHCVLRGIIADDDPNNPKFRFLELENIDMSENAINYVETDTLGYVAANLTKLNLSRNALSAGDDFSCLYKLEILDLSWNHYRDVPNLPSSLRTLNISHNRLNTIREDDFNVTVNLEILDLSYCRIESIEAGSFANLHNLEWLILHGNRIQRLHSAAFTGLQRIRILDLSSNFLTDFDPTSILGGMKQLETLTLDGNPIRDIRDFPADLIHLTNLSITRTNLMYFDLSLLASLPNLHELILRDNSHLRSCVGAIARRAPALRRLDLSRNALTQLRTSFFENVTTLREVNLSENQWACDCRLEQWLGRLHTIPNVRITPSPNSTAWPCSNRTKTTNASGLATATVCEVGISHDSGSIQRTMHGSALVLDCRAYGDPSPAVIWEQPIRKKLLGQWPEIREHQADHSSNYMILPGGLLLINRVVSNDVGPYRCIVQNQHGNASSLIFVRLDYSSWWEMKLYSVLCGIVTAIGFFILNVIYASIRRFVIWKISKLEQTSRVRLLLEAMEKYRQRQMDSLHEKYNVRMQQIRENYHGQVDQVRRSYMTQSERFRDYRAAQMETMTHHIEVLRENYNWQAARVREYGSRQMERLWESYQRQVNRVRAFSLQQRLRLMRQYKIKQQYWNKMFDSINLDVSMRPPNQVVPAEIPPDLIELPELLPPDDELTMPMHMNRTQFDSISVDEFDDAVSVLITIQQLEDNDDLDGLSYHSASDTHQQNTSTG